jgi:predicted alpha/beta-fold hydrolase
VQRARTIFEFDDAFTAPLHGFRGTADYWARASALPHLSQLHIPTLILNALNDPFVPAGSLARRADVARHVSLWQPVDGGHVGFPRGLPPGDVMAMPLSVSRWLAART